MVFKSSQKNWLTSVVQFFQYFWIHTSIKQILVAQKLVNFRETTPKCSLKILCLLPNYIGFEAMHMSTFSPKNFEILFCTFFLILLGTHFFTSLHLPLDPGLNLYNIVQWDKIGTCPISCQCPPAMAQDGTTFFFF